MQQYNNQVWLDATTLKCMPPQTFIKNNLNLGPLTLKSFSAMPTHKIKICCKFHWNLSI